MAIKRYLIPSLAHRGSANYKDEVIWAEGFKDLIRLIQQCVDAHQQRINAGTK